MMATQKMYEDSRALWGKHFIGFDDLFNSLERLSQREDKSLYPPYSIYKDGDESFVISLAIAGFKKDNITIELKSNIMTVSGRKEKDLDTIEYVHRGISNRNFIRTFTLADDVEIKSASMEDGILNIHLIRDRKKNVRMIPISDTRIELHKPEQLNG